MKKLVTIVLLLLLLMPVLAKQIDQDVARLSKALEQIRGLKFSRKVPSEAQSQAQVTKYLQGLFDQEAARTPFARREVFLHQSGLLAANVSYQKSLRDLYSEQVRGLYDPAKKRFLVVTGGSSNPQEAAMQGMLQAQGLNLSMDDILTIHELDHALQDQHFDLARIDKSTAPNFDQALAAQCLIEGDATLVMMDYMASSMGLDPGMLDGMMGSGGDDSLLAGAGMPSGSKAPPFIQKLISDPYFKGMSFCSALRGQGGWTRVDAAYRRLPASSEQILHPDRYLKNDAPQTLSIKVKAAPAGWQDLGCDVAGEYLIRQMGESLVGADQAAGAAQGWGGDLYCSYRKGSQEGIIWLTSWDSQNDAKEFEAMANKLVSRGAVPGLVNRVERSGSKVLVQRNAPPNVAPKL